MMMLMVRTMMLMGLMHQMMVMIIAAMMKMNVLFVVITVSIMWMTMMMMHSRVDRFALEWADSADGVFVALR